MSARFEPDPRTPIGMLAAQLQRHPELLDRTDPDALVRVALYLQQRQHAALLYVFNGAPIVRVDSPEVH